MAQIRGRSDGRAVRKRVASMVVAERKEMWSAARKVRPLLTGLDQLLEVQRMPDQIRHPLSASRSQLKARFNQSR